LSQLAARIAGMTTGTCSVAPWNGRALRIGDNPRSGCAGTPLRPGWFLLDINFGGRKVKFVKQKQLPC